jgi:hypothetical protein
MEHSNGTQHHHHSNGNHHNHHHDEQSKHKTASAYNGELIKQSSDNDMRVCLEHTPKEFPILMTAAKSSENVIFNLNVNEYEHVHIEKSVSNSIVNFSSSELDIPCMKQTDHMRKVIDSFRDMNKSISDEQRKRMSIILNVANDIKDLCMEQFEIVSSDNDLFCKMIGEKWDRAVNEMSELSSKDVSSSSLSK